MRHPRAETAGERAKLAMWAGVERGPWREGHMEGGGRQREPLRLTHFFALQNNANIKQQKQKSL